MKHYRMPVTETAVCIIDETGKLCREVKIVSHPDDLITVLQDPAWNFEGIGLEDGPVLLP